jgi:hypothetical protein
MLSRSESLQGDHNICNGSWKTHLCFGVRQQNGWKANVSELLTKKDYETLCNLYEDVYAHPPSNGDYLTYFFVWLVGSM